MCWLIAYALWLLAGYIAMTMTDGDLRRWFRRAPAPTLLTQLLVATLWPVFAAGWYWSRR